MLSSLPKSLPASLPEILAPNRLPEGVADNCCANAKIPLPRRYTETEALPGAPTKSARLLARNRDVPNRSRNVPARPLPTCSTEGDTTALPVGANVIVGLVVLAGRRLVVGLLVGPNRLGFGLFVLEGRRRVGMLSSVLVVNDFGKRGSL